jgi:hypothetical protein
MNHHPAWLATGLIILVVLPWNVSKNSNNTKSNFNSNSSSSSNSSSDDLGSGEAIKEIHMAKDDGNGEPGEPTESFSPGDHTVHCVATLKLAKSGTLMKFAWWVVDADNTQDEKIKEIDYSTKALENIVHGHLTLPQDWPTGKYKVQVYVNGQLDRTVFYSVR